MTYNGMLEDCITLDGGNVRCNELRNDLIVSRDAGSYMGILRWPFGCPQTMPGIRGHAGITKFSPLRY